MWDADLDRRVSRTKDRPITSGKLSQFDALVFLGGQLGTATLLLMTLDWYTVCLASSSMALVVTYPLMKRITYWPQLMLGKQLENKLGPVLPPLEGLKRHLRLKT